MKTEICRYCGTEIPPNACQEGQHIDGVWYPLHVGCADTWLNEMIPVWTVTSDGFGYTEGHARNLVDLIENMDEGSEYQIERRTMKRIDYLNLPEFTGF